MIEKLILAVERGIFFHAISRSVMACGAGFYAGYQNYRGIQPSTDTFGPKFDVAFKYAPRFLGLVGLAVGLYKLLPETRNE